MITGVDIGGTKTQLATFLDDGTIHQSLRFATSHDYDTFMTDLREQATAINMGQGTICVAAVPGMIDRQAGTVQALGNLPWRDKAIADDIADAVGVGSVIIENDSKLAGLAEARHLGHDYERTLYLTLSTGIGGALVINDDLAHDVADMEIGKIPLQQGETTATWEEIASGKAFVQQFNQPASGVEDEASWKLYTAHLAQGLTIACAILQVDAVVFGGGLGQYAEKFINYLDPYLQNLHPIVKKPRLLTPAHFGDESVIYGCYEHARDRL